MTQYESLSTIISGVAVVVGFTGLFFLGIQVQQASHAARQALIDQESEWTRQRKLKTLEFSMATAEYRHQLKSRIPWKDADAVEMEDFFMQVDADIELEIHLRGYLSYMEQFAIGVNEGVLDLETATRIQGDRFVALAHAYGPYIRRARRDLGNPEIYREIEVLAATIAQAASQLSPNNAAR